MKLHLATGIVLAALLGACESNGDRNGGDEMRSGDRTYDRPMNTETGRTNMDYQPMSSTDARILSILHAKNMEEVEAGRLAQNRGASDDVRRYGEMLERHHSESDVNVRSTAEAAGITMLEPRDIKDLLAREKGMAASPPDPLDELRTLHGDQFDRAFAQKMLEGHRELIQIVENARPTVKHASVRDLLDRTLPTLREHEQEALRLVNR